MVKLPILTQAVSNHFNLHPSRQKTLVSLIYGALCSSNVHQQSLSRYVTSPNPKSALRKVERFFVSKNYLRRIQPGPLSIFWDFEESLTCALTGVTGSLGKRVSTIWF